MFENSPFTGEKTTQKIYMIHFFFFRSPFNNCTIRVQKNNKNGRYGIENISVKYYR